jgi:energy-coupling factor transporter ATP-binding protein EcfA2
VWLERLNDSIEMDAEEMLKIKVENFSCIKSAELEVKPLTIIIGPQASGKSVLTKLLYFFLEQIQYQYESTRHENSFDTYKEAWKERFAEWFPVGAWGGEIFSISFEMGDYKIRVKRTSYAEAAKDNLRLWTSAVVKESYQLALDGIKKIRAAGKVGAEDSFLHEYDAIFRLKESTQERLAKRLQGDFIGDQTFIPAGRSFFTNLGRAFTAFDQSKTLDPATLKFGRMFATIPERMSFMVSRGRTNALDSEFREMLGGKTIWEGERPIFEAIDGRKMPFSALSSGQQELLPLATLLSVLPSGSKRPKSLVVIEEPEAHLFPESQSKLIQLLAATVSAKDSRRVLILTTHSPYVLAKVNNLIKAGQVADSVGGEGAELVGAVIPVSAQMRPGSVVAYGMRDGLLNGLMDEDGLVAADYLDSISSVIGDEFMRLLEIEYSSVEG